jgi:replication factor C subunit 2/4
MQPWKCPENMHMYAQESKRLPCFQDAQNALRRIMETHSNVTRFCFICNYVSRIIEPLASRCAKFRFKPLHEDIMEERISHICREEGVEMGTGAMAMLGRVSHGDLRRAITTLQSAFTLNGNPVASAALVDMAGEVRLQMV